MQILRIYSLIIMVTTIILNSLTILGDKNKDKIKVAFIAFVLYIPVFIYLIKN